MRKKFVKISFLIVIGIFELAFQLGLFLALFYLWHNFLFWSASIINQFDMTVKIILSLLLCPIGYISLLGTGFIPMWLCDSIHRIIRQKRKNISH